MLYNSAKHACANTTVKIARAFLITATFSIFFSNISTAQKRVERKHAHTSSDTVKNKIEVGITGGLSLNRFDKAQPQTGYNTGYTGGLLVNYKVYKNFSLQLEANFLQQGGQMISFKDDTRYGLPESFSTKNVKNSSYQLNSIEVPLLVNYTFNIKQAWRPSVYAGASYAHTFNVTENYQKTGDLLTGEDIIATVDGSQNVSNTFNNNRFNFIVGANTKLPLAKRLSLLIDFRYLGGLTTARPYYSYMEKTGFGTDVRTNAFITKVGLVMSLK